MGPRRPDDEETVMVIMDVHWAFRISFPEDQPGFTEPKFSFMEKETNSCDLVRKPTWKLIKAGII